MIGSVELNVSRPAERPSLRGTGWIVILAAAVVCFTNLGGVALWDEDEPKNAVCAREMLSRADWVVPTFNGQLRTDKPILLYWLMLTAYSTFGVNEFSARFWSAALGVVTVWLTFDLGRRLYGRQTGLWSGLSLAGSFLFCVSARAATPDATFICCTTLALWCFARAAVGESQKPGETQRYSLGMYAALGLAVLAKGPSGLVLPLGVAGLFLTLQRFGEIRGQSPAIGVQRFASVIGNLTASAGMALARLRLWQLLITAIIALPWYITVGLRTDWAWPLGFLGRHNVQRFMGPMEGHGGPIVYYVPAILIGLLPWSVWLPSALTAAVRRMRSSASGSPADLFLLCWVSVYVGCFSFAGTKLPTYVLPCYPALAILIGRLLDGWIHEPFVSRRFEAATIDDTECRRDRRTQLAGLGMLVLLGLAILIGLPLAASQFMPGDGWLGIVGAIPLVSGLAAWRLHKQQRIQFAMGTFAASSLVLCAVMFGLAADRVDNHQPTVAFAEEIRRHPTARGVATLDAFLPSLVFYSGEIVTDCPTPIEAGRFLEQSPNGCLVTRADQWELLQPHLPANARVLDRRKMFLRRHELLLIGREPTSQLASAASRSR